MKSSYNGLNSHTKGYVYRASFNCHRNPIKEVSSSPFCTGENRLRVIKKLELVQNFKL